MKECSHGAELDIPCLECELVSLDETIFSSGIALSEAINRQLEVVKLIKEQKQELNDVMEGLC